MNDTTYCILITVRAAFLAEGEWSGVIHHARHEAGFFIKHIFSYGELEEHISDTFSNLLDIFIYIFCFL